MNKQMVLAGVAAVILAITVWAQSVVVCPACGRESKQPSATTCAHCSAVLPKPRPDNATVEKHATQPADKEVEVGHAAKEVVDACVRQARELEEKQPNVAFGYYQNALALMRLVPAGTYPASVGESVLAGNRRVMQTLQRGSVPCKRCNGSGKYQLDLGKVDRTQGVKAISGVACPACKGQGSFVGYREVSKVKMTLLQGRQEFEQRQMVAGDVKVGRALVPAALEKLLTNRQRALVMTGVPIPCPECQLTARQACSSCRGSGWVKCSFAGCSKGEIKEARASGSRQAKRMNEDVVKKCPHCEGLAEVTCERCRGSGGVACSTCDGSGQAPRCMRCTGTGLAVCTKCKGVGEVKGSCCPECKGETVVLCPTCRGEGALSR